MKKIIERNFRESIDLKEEVLKTSVPLIVRIANVLGAALKKKRKILFCGNGGSAADCQHIAAEFIGRFQTERRSLPAIALTTDTSILTAIGNDYGFDRVFARQVEGLGQKGDVLIAISTSGNSVNVLEAVTQAKKMGIKTVSFTGRDGGKLARVTDLNFNVPSKNTARVQEVHILAAHCLCEVIEQNLV